MNFVDLKEQYRRYKGEIQTELNSVLESAQFIMGPAVKEFESEISHHSGAVHSIGCASGTDAITLALLALDVRHGDEILVPDFTFFATAEAPALLGAVPVFIDVRADTYCLDANDIENRITCRTKGLIPVSLFGQCADMQAINEIAQKHRLWVIEDAAQSYGATTNGRRSATLSEVATTSFYPAKPLGCYGDGGAVFTSNNELAQRIRELLNHGQVDTYNHTRVGINGRLDALQAAILRVKLRHFDEEMEMKQKVADRYSERLAGKVTIPTILNGNTSVWAQYTIRSLKRPAIISHLKSKGIPTAVHYPRPLHAQKVFCERGLADQDYPVATQLSAEVVSLPMHPFLSLGEVDSVCDAIFEAIA